MKKAPPSLRPRLAVAALALLCLQPFSLLAADAPAKFEPVKLQSLRGSDASATDVIGEGARREKDHGPIARNYEMQPPLIPHNIQGYNVTKNFNKCFDCHAPARAPQYNATKVPASHFKTREGQELVNISPRRYFCNQCHVPQSDAKPLVNNTFQPAAGFKKN
jgi:cytochrome c-type protein NapB